MVYKHLLNRRAIVALLVVLPVLLYWQAVKRVSWLPRTRKVHQTGVETIAFSPDGTSLVSQSSDRTGHREIVMSDAHSLHLVRTLPVPKSCEIVAPAPNLKTIACSEKYVHHYEEYNVDENKRRIMLYDATTGKRLSICGGYYSIEALVFSPHGNLLAAGATSTGPTVGGSYSGHLTLWQVQGHTLRGPLLQGFDRILCIAFSPDSKDVATGLIGGTLKLWSTKSRKLRRTLDAHKGEEDINDAVAVSFSPHGKLLASGHADNTVWLWNTQTGKPLRVLKKHTKAVWAVAFSPDGAALVSGGEDGVVKLWNPQTGRERRTLKAQHGAVQSIAFTPDGATLAIGYKDGTISLWRIK